MQDAQVGQNLFNAIVEGAPTHNAQELFARSHGIWRCSSFTMNSNTGQMIEANTFNFDPRFFSEYQSNYADQCLWRRSAFNQWPLNPIFVASRAVPFERIRQTGFYNDWLQPNRLFDELICLMARSVRSDELSGMTIYPRFGSGPFQDEDLASLARRAGAFISYLQLRARAINNSVDAEFFRRAIADDADGVYLVTNDLDVRISVPGVSQSMPESFLRVICRKVEIRDPRTHRKLAALVQRINGEGPSIEASRPCTFSLPSGEWILEGERIVIVDPGWGFERSLVLLRVISRRKDRLAQTVLRERGLSVAEVEIVLSLAAGLSPAEIANQRQRSVQTIRAQLRAAREKLGVHRQAQLVTEVLQLTR